MHPLHVLAGGALCIILIGTLLLMLPAATADGRGLPFFDALFTATSASCVTGLVVVDTGTAFSFFGQLTVLFLIQLGGLGFMTASTILFLLLRKRISLRERITIAEGLGESRLQGIVKLGLNAVLVTLTLELAGAILLAIRFIPDFGPKTGIWYAIFHSVSAFCNAGFDLMGGYVSLMDYAADPLVLLTVMFLVITGGLGFTVVLNMREKRRFRHMNLHTKLVLSGTAGLILVGALLVYLLESGNEATLAPMSFPVRVLNSFFQSVTWRTAGFNTIDQASMTDPSKFLGLMWMLIGGAPAGTAGGLKITTVLLLVLTVRSHLQGRRDTEAFGRSIATVHIRRALSVTMIGIMTLCVAIMLISIFESHAPGAALGFLNQAYEAVSALGTVGLSSGLTGVATPASRAVLICLMFGGRVGLLTLALALANRKRDTAIRYPEEDILIG